LRFAGDAGDHSLGRKITEALPVSMLVNTLALLLALAFAIPLGARAGMRVGGALDRVTSWAAFIIYGVPEFLMATLLLLVLGGGFFAPWFPSVGLQSEAAGSLGLVERIGDLVMHLVLPVGTLALGYGAMLYRFLRESVARAAGSDFARALRGFGMPEAYIRRRVLRNGISPVVTLLGTMLPVLVGGTVVVETIFALPGIGQLTIQAVGDRDMPLVMALTMLVSVTTMLSFIAADIVQRVIDPRVELL
jgi:peptide/nickel transport system permease protein